MKPILTLATFVVLLDAVCGHASAVEPKLNVLFIAVDDLRLELGCDGAPEMQTRNFDRRAMRGLLFERVYCRMAVCNLSPKSVLTGCRPDTARIFNHQTFPLPMMPDVVTLPQHFMSNGYAPISLGKFFHHSERERSDDPQCSSKPTWYHGEPCPAAIILASPLP